MTRFSPGLKFRLSLGCFTRVFTLLDLAGAPGQGCNILFFVYFSDDIDSLCTSVEQSSAIFSTYFSPADNESILLQCSGEFVKTTLKNVHKFIDEIPDEKLFSCNDDDNIQSNNGKGNITEKETTETRNVRFYSAE